MPDPLCPVEAERLPLLRLVFDALRGEEGAMSEYRWSDGSGDNRALRWITWAGALLAHPALTALAVLAVVVLTVAAGVWLVHHGALLGALFVAAGAYCGLCVHRLTVRMDGYVFEEDEASEELAALCRQASVWFVLAMVLVLAGAALIGLRVG